MTVDKPTEASFVALQSLMFREAIDWLAAPDWVHFFIDLGIQLASYDDPGFQPVVAVSLPTRAFASALSACGIVLYRASVSHDDVSVDMHFDRLCQLAMTEVNVPVIYRSHQKGGIKNVNGRLNGVDLFDGRRVIKVLVGGPRSGYITQLVPRQRALDIQLAKKPGALGYGKQVQDPTFLGHSLSTQDVIAFVHRTKLECIILGTVTALEREIVDTTFAFNEDGTARDSGRLQDILRVRRFFPDAQHYRTEVVPVTHEPDLTDGAESQRTLIVFDGPVGFLKWRDNFRGGPWLVLLDRTDAHFHEAIAEIRSMDMSRAGDAISLKIPPIPAGIEVITFEVSP